jgi:hypothetical protein
MESDYENGIPTFFDIEDPNEMLDDGEEGVDYGGWRSWPFKSQGMPLPSLVYTCRESLEVRSTPRRHHQAIIWQALLVG